MSLCHPVRDLDVTYICMHVYCVLVHKSSKFTHVFTHHIIYIINVYSGTRTQIFIHVYIHHVIYTTREREPTLIDKNTQNGPEPVKKPASALCLKLVISLYNFFLFSFFWV